MLRDRLKGDRSFTDLELELPGDEGYSYDATIDGFFAQYAAQTGKRTIGATIHSHFDAMPEQFPGIRYLHLVRDPRPVASSILKMGWTGSIYTSARMWRQTLEAIKRLESRVAPENWLQVRFETLVYENQASLERICDFLGQAYDPAMLSYPDHTSYALPEKDVPDRWRTQMRPDEIQQAEWGAGSLLAEMGYERQCTSRLPAWRKWAFHAYDRIGRTRFRVRRFGLGLLLARKLLQLCGARSAALEARYEAIRESHIR